MGKTPVTVFSGYLGSGKTTIILNALRQFKGPVNFAMIKNEFGDASVDGALAQASSLAVKEVVNGCLCCVLVGSLNDAVNDLLDTQNPERIIIEASGDALPFPIVLELKKNDRVYLDGVISVVDCVNFEKVKDTSFVAKNQAQHTDLIIFNKVGLVDEDQLYHVKEEIWGINPDTQKIETADGVLDPRVLFGLPHDPKKWAQAETDTDHHHTSQTFAYKTGKKLDQVKLTQVLNATEPSRFYRIKGIVQNETGEWLLVNSVFGRLDIKPLSNYQGAGSRLIFIGQKINEFQDMVFDYLDQATL